MTYVYHGYLFGHYDSRGGTTFVEFKPDAVEPLNEAAHRYLAAFGMTQNEIDCWPEKDRISIAEWEAQMVEDELICAATLTSDVELTPMMDLTNPEEAGDNQLWVQGTWASEDEEDKPGGNFFDSIPTTEVWNHVIRLHFGKKPEGEWTTGIRWDDDAYGMIFQPKDRDGNNEPA